MKRRFFFILLFLFSALMILPAQTNNEITVPLSHSGERGKLHVDIKKGPITVVGTGRDDVLVRYTSLEDPEPQIEEVAGGLKKISGGMADLEVIEKDNQVYVGSDSWHRGLELYIEVPRNMDLDLHSYHDGDIIIGDVDGEHVVESFHGPVTAENIGGSLLANTYHGPIKVIFTKVTPETPLAFTTYHGDVDVTFPASVAASFKLKTDRGDIYTGFDMQLSTPKVQEKREEDGRWRRAYIDGWITGSINGGGAEVTMKNYHGDIFIRKR